MTGDAIDRLTQCRYKFVTSERFKTGIWYAISEDDNPLEPKSMAETLNELGSEGWELITVVPIGESTLNHDQLLKHIFKRPEI
jgi:hypothetical protein